MKKIIFIAIFMITFVNLDKIRDLFDPLPNLSSITEGSVVLYSTSTCNYCLKTKKLFEKMGVKYVEYDIERSQQGFQQYQQLGGKGVPVIVIGSTIIHGYSKAHIIETLKKI